MMTGRLKTRWMELLGYAGLIPFLGLAGIAAWFYHTPMADLYGGYNLIYGACILSFLGAVHWGIAIAQAAQPEASYRAGLSDEKFEMLAFGWGVVPSLLAWVIVAFAPDGYALWLLAATVALVGVIDHRILGPMKGFEDYLKLRTRLSALATLGLLVTAWAI
ncbi:MULTISPECIES: DUF3429 domain-containing protein [Limnobacter]|nr:MULTISPECIES: DUF3429 domain-containing protein [Limnobacter]